MKSENFIKLIIIFLFLFILIIYISNMNIKNYGIFLKKTGDNATGNYFFSDNITMENLILENGEPISWNTDKGTINIPTGVGNTIQVGQELTLMRKNLEGKEIYEGQIVYVIGSQGDRITVGLADASNGTKTHNLGMVTIPVCNNNADCPITYFGEVNELDTTKYNCELLYLSDDGSGNATCILPTNNNSYHIHIGEVQKNDSNNGIIDFKQEIDFSDEPVFNKIKVLNNLEVRNTITGNNTGNDICIDNNNKICKCGSCA